MKTKSSSRSAKKKPAPPARARAAKPTSARVTTKNAAAPKKAAVTPAKTPAAALDDKYRQSGAPWWKQFL